MSLPDRPVADPQSDLLNRNSFAKTLCELIASFPTEESYRIGVYGSWGEGKTSVLRLLDHHLTELKAVTVWVPPWGAGNSTDLLARLLKGVADALDIKTSRWDRFSRAAKAAGDLSEASVEFDWKLRAANTVLQPCMNALSDHAGSRGADLLLQRVIQKLNNRPLVIMVDDLDRVRPEILPDFLLTIREITDLPGFHYVLALSPAVLSQGLKTQHPEWSQDEQEFLDKIVEYPFYLPSCGFR